MKCASESLKSIELPMQLVFHDFEGYIDMWKEPLNEASWAFGL